MITLTSPRYLDLLQFLSRIPNITAQALGPIVITRRPAKDMPARTIRHEKVHVYQWAEVAAAVSLVLAPLTLLNPWLGLLCVWAWFPGVGAYSALYGLMYLERRGTGDPPVVAYYGNPLEKEARIYSRAGYTRRAFGWLRLETS